MKIGIVSDIHSNLAAFQTALDYLKNEGIEEMYCLGDIIGYNSSAKECLDLIREHNITSIRGNHERYVIGEIHESVKPATLQVIEYTREQFKNPDWVFLEELPNKRKIEEHQFMVVHGSPRHKDEYIHKMDSIIGNIKKMQETYSDWPLCFFGHTHHSAVLAQGQLMTDIKETKTVPLDKKKQTLVNPGSIGQPRDRCTKTAFGIFDTEEWAMTFVRLDYEVQDTIDRNKAANFPEVLSDRLKKGK